MAFASAAFPRISSKAIVLRVEFVVVQVLAGLAAACAHRGWSKVDSHGFPWQHRSRMKYGLRILLYSYRSTRIEQKDFLCRLVRF
jgi:hypothetical protein